MLCVCPAVCLSVCVCVSVTLRYCIKTAKRRITQIMPYDRSGTLVYQYRLESRIYRMALLVASRGPSALAELLVNFGGPIHILGMAEARVARSVGVSRYTCFMCCEDSCKPGKECLNALICKCYTFSFFGPPCKKVRDLLNAATTDQ